MDKKKVVFLTGTRADFGKLKPLIEIVHHNLVYDVHLFATGMHMSKKYGLTVDEIVRCGYSNIYRYINHHDSDTMDIVLAKTVSGFSDYIKEIKPDLIVVHGDRVEALAGSITGALNNILVGHIEGGEVSGTIDELIRHSVSKMSHVHFVANEGARRRLVQMGEDPTSVYVIGSPDIDIMQSGTLPTLASVQDHYGIPFSDYGILLFHPVTTEQDSLGEYAQNLVAATIASQLNYVVIFPNNDSGTQLILDAFSRFSGLPQFRVFPSMRFESFLVLMEHAQLIVGNSSAGIREAPVYGVPTVNIGTRQNRRISADSIIDCDYSKEAIIDAISRAQHLIRTPCSYFGDGKSASRFGEILATSTFWEIPKQKYFIDVVPNVHG